MTNPDISNFKATVIGSGVMGAAIAAHFANAGIHVTLLDIVPEAEKDGRRDMLAENAIAGLMKRKPAPLSHEKNLRYMTAGNLEDDIQRIAEESDWIVEAIIERADIKRDLYARIAKHLNGKAILSSNTSTIPMAELTKELNEDVRSRFGITHFFNPPRYMRLVELVKPEQAHTDAFARIESIITYALGKEIVPCNDTPGFIANRIGCFWIAAGIGEAKRYDITPEEADAVLSAPFGIPKTGVFGLCDLIGIDLMPLIANAFSDYLPEDDAFFAAYGDGRAMIQDMIDNGFTGRKGNGGFYRLEKKGDGRKEKQARDLDTGTYRTAERAKPDVLRLSKEKGLAALFASDDRVAKYAKAVMGKTLLYAASVAEDIAFSVQDIDRAMRAGYNWKHGPFALIDKAGAQTICDYAQHTDINAAPILQEAAANGGFFTREEDSLFYITGEGAGARARITYPTDELTVARAADMAPPVLKNGSAALYDIGDGIACLEFRSKMNSVDPDILDMLEKTIERVEQDFKGLVIANDADNFCVGANLGVLLFAANTAGWTEIEDIIARGQNAYDALKYAPFPVVGAPTGMALGGGCELLLHCDAVQAHIECYAGLVEAGVGVLPGWGGCKEMLWKRIRPAAPAEDTDAPKKPAGMLGNLAAMAGGAAGAFNTLPAIKDAFEAIALAKVSTSAEHAREMYIIGENDGITMNRSKLLHDAKERCKNLAEGYAPPRRGATVKLPGKTAQAALKMAVNGFVKKGVASPYDAHIAEHVAYVLTGGDTSLQHSLTEQDLLKLERDAFMALIREKKTLARIEHMLEKGKPLRN